MASLESVLDEVLPKKLLQNEVGKVKSIVSYAMGKGSLSEVNSVIDDTLQSNASADVSVLIRVFCG